MSIFKKFLCFITVFFFIFAPRFNVAGGINGGVLSVLFVFVATMLNRRMVSLPRPLLIIFLIFCFFALYSACMAELYGNDPSFFLKVCISAVISIYFSWFFAELLSKSSIVDEKLLYFVILLVVSAIFVNSLVVVFEYVFPPFKAFLESLLFQEATANINYAEHAFRFRGFSSAGGAALSIVNALGVLLVVFLVLKNELRTAVGILFAVVMVASNVFTGRTGLIFGIGFLSSLMLLIFVRLMLKGVRGIIIAIGFILLVAVSLRYAFNFELDPEVASWAFEWVDGLASGRINSTSSDDLGTMLFLPDNVVDLLFGIGFFEGDSSLYPRSDSGYVKTVLTVGALVGALLYTVIAYMFLSLRKYQKDFSWLVIPVLAFMFIVEIKEPFFYQNFAARVIFLLSGAAMYLLNQRRNACTSYNSRT